MSAPSKPRRGRSRSGVALQCAGGAGALAGVFLLAGLAVALLVGGVAAFAVGALVEAGRI